MKVSALVKSLSQPIKLTRSPTNFNFLNSQSHRRKVKQRPKSAGVRRCKPGTLSRAVRTASMTGYSDRRRRRRRNRQKSLQSEEKPRSGNHLLTLTDSRLKKKYTTRPPASANEANSASENPWSVFQSGGDYRMQQYGDNKAIGSALLKVDLPREFSKSLKVEVRACLRQALFRPSKLLCIL